MTEPEPVVSEYKGVQLSEPPGAIIGTVTRMVNDAVREMPADARIVGVGIATTKGGQLAVVARIPHGWHVVGWVGKPNGWGLPIEGGAAVRFAW